MSKDKQKKNKLLEDEMNVYGLDDYEKDLVRNGGHDPWDFNPEGEDDDCE